MKQQNVLRRGLLRPYLVAAAIVVGLGLLLSAMASAAAAAPASQSAEEGQRILQQTCTACHTIGGGVRVGPDLQGVTERREASWLKVHIQTPSIHQAQNDPISVENRQKFGLPMPDLGLTEQQAEAVIAALGAGGSAQPAGIPALYGPTLIAALLALVVLTFVGLRAGTKKVEVSP
jgi:mono/diheme cytochrome c family protein